MSVYLRKGRGWMYDFVLRGDRHTSRYYKTKANAKRAEAARKEELLNPTHAQSSETTPTDMAFLELVNRRLDHVKVYNSERHYEEHFYAARKWIERWGHLKCSQIDQRTIEEFVLERSRVSAFTANKEIRYLKATFNFGIKKGIVEHNPVNGLDFLPVDKKRKFIPSPQEIELVITEAKPDTQDYLWVVRDTMARISEINALTWDDVDFQTETITLYTRKKRGGHRTPRVIPMTQRLKELLHRRYRERDQDKPWVFWARTWNREDCCWKEGPYKKRQALMRKLCDRAGVRRFGFHALRHAGATLLDSQRVPIRTIQRILGHENRTTTEIYLHSVGESEKAAMVVFEKASNDNPVYQRVESPEKSQPKSQPQLTGRPRLKLVKG